MQTVHTLVVECGGKLPALRKRATPKKFFWYSIQQTPDFSITSRVELLQPFYQWFQIICLPKCQPTITTQKWNVQNSQVKTKSWRGQENGFRKTFSFCWPYLESPSALSLVSLVTFLSFKKLSYTSSASYHSCNWFWLHITPRRDGHLQTM